MTVDGPRAVDDVWDRYVRPSRWPEWSPQIRSVDYPFERLVAGSSGVVHGAGGLTVRCEITELDDDGPVRTWSWTAHAGGVQLALRHTVEPHDGGARTGLTIEGFPPVVIAYAPVARLALRRLVS